MTEQVVNKWMWWGGRHEEVMTEGPFDTRDEAVQVVTDDLEGGYVMEAIKTPLRLCDNFDADTFIDNAEERNYDMTGEDGDPMFEVTPEQAALLGVVVRTAIATWERDNKLVFVPWLFSKTRNEEFIEIPDTPVDDGDEVV